jgi:HAD superfamily hydrolase (TIGR01549 family)
MVPAVTFDLWHTLVFLDPPSEEAYMEGQVGVARRALTGATRLPGAPEVTEEALGKLFEASLAEAVAEAGEGRTVTQVEQLRRAGRKVGRVPDEMAYVKELERLVRVTPFQRATGALELLEALTHDGYRLGLISNTVGEPGQSLRPMLSTMGFDPYFKTYVFSDEHPWTKPAPELFRVALHGLATAPESALHVGDGWSDIEGARRTGMRAGVLFTGLRDYGPRYRALHLTHQVAHVEADVEVRRLDEVREVARRLLPIPRG